MNGAGDLVTPNIIRWDGSDWHEVGGGIGDLGDYSYVLALASYGGDLIAGGRFFEAGGISVRRIARWDGSEWHSLGGGMTGGEEDAAVMALTTYQGALIAAGYFNEVEELPINFIAEWDGDEWRSLGSGLDDPGYALAVHQGGLYVGGELNFAGGKPSWGIGGWMTPAGHILLSSPLAPDNSFTAPNPYRPNATILLTGSGQEPTWIHILDAVGRRIRTLRTATRSGAQVLAWDGQDEQGQMMGSGVYFIREQRAGVSGLQRIVLVRP